jgi:pimeloyl-ACP methyl ester carboxylesterase
VDNPRKYGNSPYNVALVHGGPGAPGEMAPVARELSGAYGVLEPLQTRSTLDGQVLELETLLKSDADPPINLVGYSWGAILSYILTARNPDFVRKLILVSSGVFSEEYTDRIMRNRLRRLYEKDRSRMDELLSALKDPGADGKNDLFAQLAEILEDADSYDPLPHENDVIEYQHDIFKHVWDDVLELRGNGGLIRMGKDITCPVVAIHGDFDPHPHEGIKIPLSGVLGDFRLILLKNCGHHPWYEKHARDAFYMTMRKELSDTVSSVPM